MNAIYVRNIQSLFGVNDSNKIVPIVPWFALKDIQDFPSALSQLMVGNWLMKLWGDMWPVLVTGRGRSWHHPIRDCSYYENWMINYPDLLHWIIIWWISFILLTWRSFSRVCHKISSDIGPEMDYLHWRSILLKMFKHSLDNKDSLTNFHITSPCNMQNSLSIYPLANDARLGMPADCVCWRLGWAWHRTGGAGTHHQLRAASASTATVTGVSSSSSQHRPALPILSTSKFIFLWPQYFHIFHQENEPESF